MQAELANDASDTSDEESLSCTSEDMNKPISLAAFLESLKTLRTYCGEQGIEKNITLDDLEKHVLIQRMSCEKQTVITDFFKSS